MKQTNVPAEIKILFYPTVIVFFFRLQTTKQTSRSNGKTGYTWASQPYQLVEMVCLLLEHFRKELLLVFTLEKKLGEMKKQELQFPQKNALSQETFTNIFIHYWLKTIQQQCDSFNPSPIIPRIRNWCIWVCISLTMPLTSSMQIHKNFKRQEKITRGLSQHGR